MSEYSAKSLRDARKAKAKKMGSADPQSKVDSSDWTPPEPLKPDVKTGMRPLSRRAFKSGGKVEGKANPVRADKAPRKKSGGSIGIAMANKNMKAANEEREGQKQVGGMMCGGRAKKANGGSKSVLPEDRKAMAEMEASQKGQSAEQQAAREAARKSIQDAENRQPEIPARKHGGRAKKMDGGPMGPDPRLNAVPPTQFKFAGGNQGTPYKKGGKVHSDEAMDKALIKKMVKPEARTQRKSGGRTKGKTNINIVIGQPKQDAASAMPPGGMKPPMPAGAPLPMPVPPPGAGMPMGGGAPMPVPAAGPSMPPPSMARKAGGRVTKVASSYKDMEAGAASGEGRLQKTDIAKKTMKTKFEKGDIDFDGRGYPNKVTGATGGRTARKAGGKVYRSYKDMDAGAGSGEGRLEKAEIERSQRGR